MSKYIPTLTHEERRERRRRMAAAVDEGRSPEDVAITEGVHVGTVKTACKTEGVALPIRRGSPRTLVILAAILRGEDSAKIAKTFGVSESRVRHIRGDAKRAGIQVPGESER